MGVSPLSNTKSESLMEPYGLTNGTKPNPPQDKINKYRFIYVSNLLWSKSRHKHLVPGTRSGQGPRPSSPLFLGHKGTEFLPWLHLPGNTTRSPYGPKPLPLRRSSSSKPSSLNPFGGIYHLGDLTRASSTSIGLFPRLLRPSLLLSWIWTLRVEDLV